MFADKYRTLQQEITGDSVTEATVLASSWALVVQSSLYQNLGLMSLTRTNN